jgi:AcrR family transcriptional regulator
MTYGGLPAHTSKDIAKYLGVSRATLYRYLANDAA